MKIHQLPDGARFEYEGEEYVKTGPMFATGKGGQRLIPKYAVLKPLDPAPATSPAKSSPGAISPEAVRTAFDTFYATCVELVPASQLERLRAARTRFLSDLGSPPARD